MARLLMIAVLAASIVLNVFFLLNRPQEVSDQKKYGRVEQRLIEKSESLWRQKEPRSTVEQQGRFAQVIHFPDRTCVSFELKPGGVGGVPVYCFNPSNDELVQRTDEVE